ncbi:MAG: hypothetical protein MJZ68_05680 [archaeon]|nr:hypothetical protein [archaeon]
MQRMYCPLCKEEVEVGYDNSLFCPQCGRKLLVPCSEAGRKSYTSTQMQPHTPKTEYAWNTENVPSETVPDANRPEIDYAAIDEGKALVFKVATIVLTLATFAMAMHAAYVQEYEWTLYNGAKVMDTLYGIYEMDDGGFLVHVLAFIALFTAIGRPKYLPLAYMLFGFLTFLGAEDVDASVGFGVPIFFVSFAIGYTVYRWEMCTYGTTAYEDEFTTAFWLGLKK